MSGIKPRHLPQGSCPESFHCDAWIIVDPEREPRFSDPIAVSYPIPCQQSHQSFKKRSLPLGSSPLAPTLILVLAIKRLCQRLDFAFLPCSFYFLFLLFYYLFLESLLCISGSPSLCICQNAVIICSQSTKALMWQLHNGIHDQLLLGAGRKELCHGFLDRYFKVWGKVIMSYQT